MSMTLTIKLGFPVIFLNVRADETFARDTHSMDGLTSTKSEVRSEVLASNVIAFSSWGDN